MRAVAAATAKFANPLTPRRLTRTIRVDTVLVPSFPPFSDNPRWVPARLCVPCCVPCPIAALACRSNLKLFYMHNSIWIGADKERIPGRQMWCVCPVKIDREKAGAER